MDFGFSLIYVVRFPGLRKESLKINVFACINLLDLARLLPLRVKLSDLSCPVVIFIMVYCAAFNCNNDSRETKGSVPPIHYHVFATEESILKQWLAKISRADLVVTKNSRLCSRHFDDECYERDLKAELLGTPRQFRLKPDAVPTKFSHLPETKASIFV